MQQMTLKLRTKLHSESHWQCNVMSAMSNVNDSDIKQMSFIIVTLTSNAFTKSDESDGVKQLKGGQREVGVGTVEYMPEI